MPVSRLRLRILLLSLLIAAALAVTAFFRHHPAGPAAIALAPSTRSYDELMPDKGRPGATEQPTISSPWTVGGRSNPATQRSGPPDPEMQRTAAASAESAARIAADLAN